MRVLAISGSLRAGSYNTALVRAAAELAPAGAEVEVYDDLRSLPLYDADLDVLGATPAVVDLRDRVAAADALLFATPEYNGSIAGVMKNAVDWISTPRHDPVVAGKTATVIGASTGRFGGVWAQEELRRVLGIAHARVVPTGLSVARAATRIDEDGTLDEALREQLAGVLRELAAAAEPLPVAA